MMVGTATTQPIQQQQQQQPLPSKRKGWIIPTWEQFERLRATKRRLRLEKEKKKIDAAVANDHDDRDDDGLDQRCTTDDNQGNETISTKDVNCVGNACVSSGLQCTERVHKDDQSMTVGSIYDVNIAPKCQQHQQQDYNNDDLSHESSQTCFDDNDNRNCRNSIESIHPIYFDDKQQQQEDRLLPHDCDDDDEKTVVPPPMMIMMPQDAKAKILTTTPQFRSRNDSNLSKTNSDDDDETPHKTIQTPSAIAATLTSSWQKQRKRRRIDITSSSMLLSSTKIDIPVSICVPSKCIVQSSSSTSAVTGELNKKSHLSSKMDCDDERGDNYRNRNGSSTSSCYDNTDKERMSEHSSSSSPSIEVNIRQRQPNIDHCFLHVKGDDYEGEGGGGISQLSMSSTTYITNNNNQNLKWLKTRPKKKEMKKPRLEQRTMSSFFSITTAASQKKQSSSQSLTADDNPQQKQQGRTWRRKRL